jgi:excisionase family DNA binding protein
VAKFGDWLTTYEAARLSGYNLEYVRRLIRARKLDSKRWGRDWMISRASLLSYAKNGKRRGPRPQHKKPRV